MKIKKTLFKTEFEFDMSELHNLHHFIFEKYGHNEKATANFYKGLYEFLRRVFSK